MDGAVELDSWGREMHWEVDEWGVLMGGVHVGELHSSRRRVPWELGSWGDYKV